MPLLFDAQASDQKTPVPIQAVQSSSSRNSNFTRSAVCGLSGVRSVSIAGIRGYGDTALRFAPITLLWSSGRAARASSRFLEFKAGALPQVCLAGGLKIAAIGMNGCIVSDAFASPASVCPLAPSSQSSLCDQVCIRHLWQRFCVASHLPSPRLPSLALATKHQHPNPNPNPNIQVQVQVQHPNKAHARRSLPSNPTQPSPAWSSTSTSSPTSSPPTRKSRLPYSM